MLTLAADTSAGLLHVAPMLAVTDRHHRYLCRLLSRRTVLWSEMVHADAVKHAGAELLPFSHDGPCVFQLGGSSPSALAAAAAAEACGYGEVNLNCGCPSAKVCDKQDAASCFGARLMLDSGLAGECLRRMAEAVDVPVSVKCRLGVGASAGYDDLCSFVETVVADSGIRHVVVHARAALLDGGVSTSANRRVPPLRHDHVYRLKGDHPSLRITLNGGVESFEQAASVLHDGNVDSVMLGRAVRKDPWLLTRVDGELHGDEAAEPRLRASSIVAAYREYVESVCAQQPTPLRAARVRLRAERALGAPTVERWVAQHG